jgi:nucleoside-diphosphate-sugar epimerase
MKVLVSGASGFIGRAVVHRLAEQGDEVVAIVRSAASVAGAAQVVRITDLSELSVLAPVMRGVDAVIHLAARVHVMRETSKDPYAAFRAVNVEGTRHLLNCALFAGVRRFAYVSTAKVHGEGGVRAYRPDDILAPDGPYASSKREAEALIENSSTTIEWTIVRPPLVYGPGVGGNFRRLLHLAKLSQRLPLPLGGINNRRSLLYVENMADLLHTVIRSPAAVGRHYLLADSPPVSTSSLVAQLAAAMGDPAQLWQCPSQVVGIAARLLGLQSEIHRLLGSFEVDFSALERDLQWTPPVPTAVAIDRTVRGWKNLK